MQALMQLNKLFGQDMSASSHAIVLWVFVWSATRAFYVKPIADI